MAALHLVLRRAPRALRSFVFCSLAGGILGCSRAEAPPVMPPPSPAAFHFRPERVEVGALYHYIKSNRDGSHAGRVYAYAESATRLDVLKHEPGAAVSVNIVADLNWHTFSAERLEMWYDHADGARHRVLSARDDGGGLVLTLDDPRGFSPQLLDIIGLQPRRVVIPGRPAHVYGFELLTLNFALRHLTDPLQPFAFALVGDNPSLSPESPALLAYLGDAWMRPLGAELRGSATTHKWQLSGPAFGSQEGYIWADSERQHIVDLELPIANNGEWRDFKLALQSVRTLSGAEWQRWKSEATAAYLAPRAAAR